MDRIGPDARRALQAVRLPEALVGRRAGAWVSALALHMALAGLATILAAPRVPETQVVMISATLIASERRATDGAAGAPVAPSPEDFRFDLAAPSTALELPVWRGDLLRSYERSDAPDAVAAPEAVRRALAAYAACLEHPEERRAAGALSDAGCAALSARAAAAAEAAGLSSRVFLDLSVAEVSAAERRLEQADGAVRGVGPVRDGRLGSASEMRESLTPAHPHPLDGN